MCPDRESHLQPFTLWDNAQPTEPHLPGPPGLYLVKCRHLCFISILWEKLSFTSAYDTVGFCGWGGFLPFLVCWGHLAWKALRLCLILSRVYVNYSVIFVLYSVNMVYFWILSHVPLYITGINPTILWLITLFVNSWISFASFVFWFFLMCGINTWCLHFLKIFIVIQLQLYAFSPHPPPQFASIFATIFKRVINMPWLASSVVIVSSWYSRVAGSVPNRHTREITNECMNKQNNKSVSLSHNPPPPPPFLSLPPLKNK